MSTVTLIVAGLMLIPMIVVVTTTLLFVVHFRSHSPTQQEKEASRSFVPVDILVPVKGLFARQEEILTSLLVQSHPDYQVIFLVDSKSDPVNSLIDSLCERYPHACKVVAGFGSVCAQKNHCLIQGMKHLRPETEIVVFCDSTNIVDSEWLGRFTEPVASGEVEVATTHRVFNPLPATTGGICQAGYGVIIFVLTWLKTMPWGGGTAIRRGLLTELDVAGAWANTISDDMILGNVLNDAGIPVKLDTGARMTTPLVQQSVGGFVSFLDRQIVSPKFTNPGIWMMTVVVVLGLFLSMVSACCCAFVLFPLGLIGYPLFYSSILFLVLLIGLGLVVRAAKPFDIPVHKWLVAFFLGTFLAAFVCFRSLFRQHVEWHGRRYMAGPNGVVIRIQEMSGREI